MGAGTSAASERAKRKRTVEDGRIIVNVPATVGRCVQALADDLGVAGATAGRMLIFEALKARGLDKANLEKFYGDDVEEYLPPDSLPIDRGLSVVK